MPERLHRASTCGAGREDFRSATNWSTYNPGPEAAGSTAECEAGVRPLVPRASPCCPERG